MKPTPTHNLFVLCLIALLLAACSKFDEGPKFSFRSVEKRVTGVYNIELLTKNDTDLTSYWNDYYDLTFDIHTLEDATQYDHWMVVKGSIKRDGYWFHFSSAGSYSVELGESEIYLLFRQYIDTTEFPGRYIYPLLVSVSDANIKFTITRLTEDQLWLKHTYGDDQYIIHFKE